MDNRAGFFRSLVDRLNPFKTRRAGPPTAPPKPQFRVIYDGPVGWAQPYLRDKGRTPRRVRSVPVGYGNIARTLRAMRRRIYGGVKAEREAAQKFGLLS